MSDAPRNDLDLPPEDGPQPAASISALLQAAEQTPILRLEPWFTQTLQAAINLEAFYLQAQAQGHDRDKAAESLRLAQGARAGSSPSSADLRAARDRLMAGA